MCSWYGVHRVLHSLPTRRSSDLHPVKRARTTFTYIAVSMLGTDEERTTFRRAVNGQHAQVVSTDEEPDRKSTRLNSSHPSISYAVFCLKKKNEKWHYYRSRANH